MSSIELSFARGSGHPETAVWICPDLSRPDKDPVQGAVYRLSAYGAILAASADDDVVDAVKQKFSFIPSAVTRNSHGAHTFMSEAISRGDDETAPAPSAAIAWVLGTRVYAVAGGELAVYVCRAGKTAETVGGEASLFRGDIVAIAPVDLQGESAATLIRSAIAVVSVQNGPVEIVKAAPVVAAEATTDAIDDVRSSDDVDEPTEDDGRDEGDVDVERPQKPRRRMRMILFVIAALVIVTAIGWITYGAGVDEENAEAMVDSVMPSAEIDSVAPVVSDDKKAVIDTVEAKEAADGQPEKSSVSQPTATHPAASRPSPPRREADENEAPAEATRGTNFAIEPGTLDEE